MQPIYCQSKNILRQSFFTLLFVQLLNIYFFSKSVLLHFNQCLGTSYLILGAGIVVKASCCQIILYIIDFAGLLILIFKINFAISTFGNLLRNVQLKLFHFKSLTFYRISTQGNFILKKTKHNDFELFFLS